MWKWVILLWRRSKGIPELALENFFTLDHRLSSISSPTLTQSSIYLLFLLCSQNWEKTRREWQFWLEGKLFMVEGRRWSSFRKLSFPLSSGLGWDGLKKDSSLWWVNFSFSFGKGRVNNFRVTPRAQIHFENPHKISKKIQISFCFIHCVVERSDHF